MLGQPSFPRTALTSFNLLQLYGSELFELNTNLMKKAIEVTKHIKLNDSAVAQKCESFGLG